MKQNYCNLNVTTFEEACGSNMRIYRGTALNDGSCNFCDAPKDSKVLVVTGRYIKVRFCLACAKLFKSSIK